MGSSSYDEDLSQNPFFQAFQQQYSQLLERCISEGWIICVPRCGTFVKANLMDHDFLGQILIPHVELPGTHFNTLTQRSVRLSNKSLVVEYEDKKTCTFELLFEEIFYNEDLDKYSLWCVEGLLERESGKSDHDQVSVVTTLKDCVNFLWTEILDKNIINEVDKLIDEFIDDTDLEDESLESQKDLIEALFFKSLSTLLKDKKLKEKSNDNKYYLQTLRVVTETYILNGLRKILPLSISVYTAEDDAALNKIMRNLCELQLSDLGIEKNVFQNILRAKLELSRLHDYFTVLGKVGCLRRAAKFISQNESSLSSDDFLPILILLIIKSGLSNWIAQLTFLKLFRFSTSPESNSDETGFLITSLEAAIEHINSGSVNPSEFLGHFQNSEISENEKDAMIESIPEGSIHLNVLFENIKLGNLNKVQNILEETVNTRPYKNQSLCHPLCTCENCKNSSLKNQANDSAVVNTRDEQGLTALHVASIYGQDAILDLILKQGADPNCIDSNEMTSLHYACLKGHQNITLLLLYAGADPRATDSSGNSALHLAADHGHEACVKALLCFSKSSKRTCNANSTNYDQDTPLHFASKWGYSTIVKILLEHGAVLLKNRRGQTPMSVAHNVFIKQLLEEAGSQNSTPLKAISARTGKLLLQVKQKIDRSSKEKRKKELKNSFDELNKIDKLFAAITEGDVWLASYYLGLDGPSNQSSDSRRENLLLCHPLCNCEKCISSEETVFEKETKPLVAVNAVNQDGESALHVASSLGCLEMIQLLLDAGAKVNLPTKSEGRTPLHLACMNNKINAVKMLVNSGNCNVDAEDHNKDTPLNLASKAGYLKIVEILVRNGANMASNSHSEK